MEMSLSCGLREELRVEQRLSLEQRLEIRLSLQSALLQAVRGERYEPRASCPKCGYRMTTVDILRGFRRDPQDYTTGCPNPKCRTRFEARLICSSAASRVELPFYCETQILGQLRPLETTSPEEVLARHLAIYRSAMFHFGSLTKAFERIGIRYLHVEEVNDWSIKVEGFLGQVPDTLIASVAGVSVRKVRQLRYSRKIKAFSGYSE